MYQHNRLLTADFSRESFISFCQTMTGTLIHLQICPEPLFPSSPTQTNSQLVRRFACYY